MVGASRTNDRITKIIAKFRILILNFLQACFFLQHLPKAHKVSALGGKYLPAAIASQQHFIGSNKSWPDDVTFLYISLHSTKDNGEMPTCISSNIYFQDYSRGIFLPLPSPIMHKSLTEFCLYVDQLEFVRIIRLCQPKNKELFLPPPTYIIY